MGVSRKRSICGGASVNDADDKRKEGRKKRRGGEKGEEETYGLEIIKRIKLGRQPTVYA